MIDTSLQGEPIVAPARSFGQQVRGVLAYALLTAAMYVSPLLVFIPAAVIHCGLRMGRRAAWLAMIGGAAIAAFYELGGMHVTHASHADTMTVVSFLLGLTLGVGLPSLVVLPFVETRETFGRIVMLALVVSLVGLGLTELIMRTAQNFSPYQDQLVRAGEMAKRLMVYYQANGAPASAVAEWGVWMQKGLYVLPAILTFDIVTVFILSLIMLSRLLTWPHLAVRMGAYDPSVYRFRNLALPEWVLFAFVAGGATPLTSGGPQQVAANILAAVSLLFLIQGLAIFRSILAALNVGMFGTIIGMGLVLVFTFGIGPLLLGIAGLFDTFFDFRHFNRKDDSHEGHTD